MKKLLLITAFLIGGTGFFTPADAHSYDFGDYRSVTLAGKAWKALGENDMEAVLAYTNKCIELYGQEARKMQDSLFDYVDGSKDKIFAYWALNDVATALFIQAEGYRKNDMPDEAREVYQKLIYDYTYGQCWDPAGWFWKPAEAAKEKLAMLDSGSAMDFGDYTSSALTTKAWNALGNNDLDQTVTYAEKVLELYEDEAQAMQESLTEYPWESNEKIFEYWALNDVGTSLFILGEAYRKAGREKEAAAVYQKLIDRYFYAQCWDPNGWFWKPAEAARQKLEILGNS